MKMSKCVSLVAVLPFALLAPIAHADDTHEVRNNAGQTQVGEPGTVSVTIQGKNGWHVNEEAPIALQVTPPAGVSVDKAKLGRPDLVESTQDRARFDVKVTATEPGHKTINAEARFVMCQESACKPVKEKVVLALEVHEPTPAAPTKSKGARNPSGTGKKTQR